MSSKMTLGDPKMNCGSTPEHHPEHPKIPNAALEPLEARSSAPVHRNRPSPAFLQKVLKRAYAHCRRPQREIAIGERQGMLRKSSQGIWGAVQS